jgi:hypothetical protein
MDTGQKTVESVKTNTTATKKLRLTRERRAVQIYNKGLITKEIGSYSYKVRSQYNESMVYEVFHDGKAKFCTCADHARTARACKHIMAVDLYKYNVIIKEVEA